MNPKFKIVSVNVDGPHASVRASVIEPKNFAVSSASKLGGVRIHSVLHQEPESGVFVFSLERSDDSTKLKVGTIVELES